MARHSRWVVLSTATLVLLWGHSALADSPHFTGLFQSYSPDGDILASQLAEMTPQGPIAGTLVPLSPSMKDITRDPNGAYYAVRSHEVYRIDPVTFQAAQLIVSGPGVPELSWPIGITFDTNRKRIVLGSLGGEGFLYAYPPSTQQWSLLASLAQFDLQAIAYRPTNDTLYGLPDSSFVSGPLNRLFKYGPDGTARGIVPLQYTIPTVGFVDSNYQMMLTSDDRLAVLSPPVSDPIDGLLSPRCYLINPDTGAIMYDAKFPVPEPSTSLVVFGAFAAAGLMRPSLRRAPRDRAQTGASL